MGSVWLCLRARTRDLATGLPVSCCPHRNWAGYFFKKSIFTAVD